MDFNPIWQQLFGSTASKKNQPDNMQALTDWFSQVFGSSTATTTNKKGKETTTTIPNQPNEYNLAQAQGPTGYTEAMRANLGFAPKWQTPNPTPATGMAAGASQPSWASPTMPSAAPTLEQALGVYVAPTPPPMPTQPTTPTPTPPAATTPQANGDRDYRSSQKGSKPGSTFNGFRSRGSIFDRGYRAR